MKYREISMIRNSLVALVLLLFLGACASVTVKDYADNKPLLDVKEFFNGTLSAKGIVKDRSGRVIRYFNADIIAGWQNGVGKLDETFYFDDGEIQKRIWTLEPDSSGKLIGSANDVIGSAELNVAGNSLFMTYVLRIPYGDGSLDLTIDDRMYLVSENTIINESVMSKWGFRVGQITLVIEKKP